MDTPNPHWLKFVTGKNILKEKSDTLDFPSNKYSNISPLAEKIFGISGVVRVFYAYDYLSVTKKEEEKWDNLTKHIHSAIEQHYESGNPLFTDEPNQVDSNEIKDEDSEAVAMIKEIIATRVRPFVQNDGGDVAFCNFDETTGKVLLSMKGSWAGCPSSQATLKNGIEKMLKYYVEEVREVEGVDAE